jgi:hypothetical protein
MLLLCQLHSSRLLAYQQGCGSGHSVLLARSICTVQTGVALAGSAELLAVAGKNSSSQGRMVVDS